MTTKRKKTGLYIGIASGVVFFVLIFALVRWRIEALEAALIRYVDIKTHGEYKLEIGKSKIDFRNVDLDFKNVTLKRTHPEKKGVRSLHIPYVHIALSSYKVFLYPDSLEIDKLIIEEPIIEIEKGETINKTHESLASHLVKLYPASKEFLQHYRVHELSIKKGGFKLTKEREDVVQVSLIDFYLYEWNAPYLSNRSQLQLNLGKQQINYERSKIKFDEISYSFTQKFIRFKEFLFSTSDSLQHTSIEISGKELLIDAIDYDQLMEFQRYKVKKIKVDNPEIKVKLTLTGTSKKNVNHDRVAVTNILKSAIGECIVDSTFIKQAKVELKIFRNKDSLKIDLPKVDLDINDFAVLNDSASFYVGGLAVNLPNTRIRLFNHLTLACDQFFFDRNSDISIGKVKVFANDVDSAFVNCERIYFDHFNLPAFAFTRELKANSITLQNANINISPDLINQVIHSAHNRSRSSKAPEISLNNFSMKDVNIFYSDDKREIEIEKAECITQNISNKIRDSIHYSLKLLAAKRVSFNTADQQQSSIITNFRHEDQWLRADELYHTDENVVVKLGNIAIYPVELSENNAWTKQCDTVKVNSAYIKGRFHNKPSQQEAHPKKELRINHLQVSSLQANLTFDKNHLTTYGKNLLVKQFDLGKKLLPFDQITGSLQQLNFKDSILHCTLDSIKLDLKGNSFAYNPRLTSNDLTVEADNLELQKTKDNSSAISLGDIIVRNVKIEKPNKLILISDSINLQQSVFAQHQKPEIEKINLYNNKINIEKNTSGNNAFNPESLFRASQLGPVKKLHLDKLELYVSGDKKADLKGITASEKNKYLLLTCDTLELPTPNMFILAQNLSASYDHLSVTSLQVMPDMESYEAQNREADLMEISLANISLLDEKNSGRAGLDILDIGEATMRIRKDKFRPDNAYAEKPFLLDNLLRPLANTGLKEVRVHNGLLAYHELSDKTNKEARVELNAIDAILSNLQKPYTATMKGTARLYNNGQINFNYQTIDSTQFDLQAEIKNMDLTLLNQVITPLEPLEIKSGHLESLRFTMKGGNEKANGSSTVTYKKLRLYIYDKKNPGQKTVKSSLISFFANIFVIRQHKRNASADYELMREKDVSPFGYWIKGALTGAQKVLREGKRKKKKR